MTNEPTLLNTFNNEMNTYIRWCTLSLHPAVPRVRGIYENDLSISLHSLGNPSMNTGIFKDACEQAAHVFNADHTLFSVNGSSGSNFVVMRALKQQLGEVKLLAQRNIHKSISVAAHDYGIDLCFLSPHYDQKIQIYLPNTVEEILDKITETNANVLLITNPTYEGLSANLTEIIQQVHQKFPHVIVYIDEAWGGLFSFNQRFPVSAMQAGADICVQSSHKQASSLQQTGFIHWKERQGGIESSCLYESYRDLTTTSPSFHLFASLDAARFFLETEGAEVTDHLLKMADYTREQLREAGINFVSPADICQIDGVAATDETKIILHFPDLSAVELAKRLEKKHRVVVEKYDLHNILLITTFQLTKVSVLKTIAALKQEISAIRKQLATDKMAADESQVFSPTFPSTIIKKMQPHRLDGLSQEFVPISQAISKVVSEDIVPYPPGIPLLMKGEEIQADHVKYIEAISKIKHIDVIMRDQSHQQISVIKS
ncbi:MAG: aminotransferase class I/II-fold pyridoxal phosphate-dependent enzyme [Patescibacteria group bacterium]